MIAPGATGDYHTKLSSKAETLVKHLTDDQKEYTFGFLHVKAVDDAGHDKNVPLKVEFLERIDREVRLWGFVCLRRSQILQHIIPALAEDSKKSGTQYVLALTGDHSTPVEVRTLAVMRVRLLTVRSTEITAASRCRLRSPKSRRR